MSKVRKNKFRPSWKVLLVFFGIFLLLGYYLVFFVSEANFREVVPHKVYRSAQPSPSRLKDWIHRYGIRTVINLRGDAGEITEHEKTAADELGVKMITYRLSSGEIPDKHLRTKLINTIETAESPMLIHCYHGVDRAGTVSALAAMAIGKMDYDLAKWQAYVPPGPWKRRRKWDYIHISDMFKLYEIHCKRAGIDTNDWQQFKQWAIDTDI